MTSQQIEDVVTNTTSITMNAHVQIHPNEQIAIDWLAAFNAHNLDALLALYDDDAIHFSPKLKLRQPESGGFVCGKAALRAWWADALQRLPSLQYEMVTLTANDKRVFMEYTRHVDGEPDMSVAEVLEVKQSRIVASRVFHG